MNPTHTTELPPDVVLKIDHVSKKFCRDLKRSMMYGVRDLTRNAFGVRGDTSTLRRDEFWALKDASLEVRRGEVLGVIGANGSGKSTLLRIITGILPPDAGEVVVRGRIGGIISLGAGFHPHMTGRENIFINGTILGMSRPEILEKFERIVDFAEIGDFLEAPVATYSSGMHVRLGFAIAIHCNPDVVLIDEVLAVGDSRFQRKCLEKISEMRKSGKALLLVSHNMLNIAGMCQKVLLLHYGEQVGIGPPSEMIAQYELKLIEQGQKNSAKRAPPPAPIRAIPPSRPGSLDVVWKNEEFGTNEVKIDGVLLRKADGSACKDVASNEPVVLEVHANSTRKIDVVNLWLAFSHMGDAQDEETATTCLGARHELTLPQGGSLIRVSFDGLGLATGSYKVAVYLHDESFSQPYSSAHYGYFTVRNPMPTLMRLGKGIPFVWAKPSVEVSE